MAREALYGASVAVSQYALAPALAMGLLQYRPEPGAFPAAPTWTSWAWIASAVVLGAAFAASWRFVATNREPFRLLIVALTCTGVYVLANTVIFLPERYGEWDLLGPLLALGFSGAAMLAFAITLIAGLASRRPTHAAASTVDVSSPAQRQ